MSSKFETKSLLRPLLAADGGGEDSSPNSPDKQEFSESSSAKNGESSDTEDHDNEEKDAEEKEKEPFITPSQLAVILLNVAAGVCLIVAILEQHWFTARQSDHFSAGLGVACISPSTFLTLNKSRSAGHLERELPFHARSSYCAEWSDLNSYFDRLFSTELLDSLNKTRTLAAISSTFSLVTAALLILARFTESSAPGRLAGLLSFIAGILALNALSAISNARGSLFTAATNSTVLTGSSSSLAQVLEYVVYDYCALLNLLASVLSIISTSMTLD